MGVTVCRRSGGAIAATLVAVVVVVVVDDVVDDDVVVVADGVMVSPLFPAIMDMDMTASSIAMFVVVSVVALQVGTKTSGQLCCQGCNNGSMQWQCATACVAGAVNAVAGDAAPC